MSEHEHPVTITDKRTKHQVQAEQELRDEHPGHGEETDEKRAARIKSALLDGKADSLTDEDKQWFLVQQEETDLPDEVQSVRSVFVIVIEHSGNVMAATPDILEKVTAEKDASYDDIYAAVCLVRRDLEARQAAGNVMMEMQRQAQQMAQQQQSQRNVQNLQGMPGMNGNRR